MDKFVIRTPKQAKPFKHEENKSLKQSKLLNLKSVVIIEEMEKAKLLLERNDVEGKLKVETLTKLSQKLPSKEVLINTKLGKTVHKLCRDSNPDVALTAKTVYDTWKKNIISKVGRPSIEVRCDLKTQKLRDKARSLICSALMEGETTDSNNTEVNILSSDLNSNINSKYENSSVMNDVESLSEYIEREVFSKTKRKTNVSYKRTNRKIVFALKFQKNVRTSVLNAKISVPQLVQTYYQE